MNTKAFKDLEIGDCVPVTAPDGIAEVMSKGKSQLFRAAGGCWRIDLKLVSGPHAGQWIKDQHHPGLDEVELVPRPA